MVSNIEYPDVGVYKLQLLRRLEKAHHKLEKTFEPLKFAECSRKELSRIISKMNAEIYSIRKEKKRRGDV